MSGGCPTLLDLLTRKFCRGVCRKFISAAITRHTIILIMKVKVIRTTRLPQILSGVCPTLWTCSNFADNHLKIISATITRREQWMWQELTWPILPMLTNFEGILILICCSTWLSRPLRNGLPCQSLRGLRQRSYGEYFYKILPSQICLFVVVQVWKWALKERNFLQPTVWWKLMRELHI